MAQRYFGGVLEGEIDPKWLTIEIFNQSILHDYIEPSIAEFETKQEAISYYKELKNMNRYHSRECIIVAKITHSSITKPVWPYDDQITSATLQNNSNQWVVADLFDKIERLDIDSQAFVFNTQREAISKFKSLRNIRNKKEYFSNLYLGRIFYKDSFN